MESQPNVSAFKAGFLEVLHQHGYEKADIPALFQKRSSVYSELIEGPFRMISGAVGPTVEALTQNIPMMAVGGGTVGGATLALALAQNEARRIKLQDEERRLNRLLSSSEEANRTRAQNGYF